jgi:hypothetical protein
MAATHAMSALEAAFLGLESGHEVRVEFDADGPDERPAAAPQQAAGTVSASAPGTSGANARDVRIGRSGLERQFSPSNPANKISSKAAVSSSIFTGLVR